jgi:tetratricopeptide (TPR) repeat protein
MLESGGSNGAAVEPIARRAVALAPRSAEAHRILAFMLFLQLKFRETWSELETVNALPGALRGDFDDAARYIWMLADLRRPEALERAGELVMRDPLNPRVYDEMGYVLATLRRYAEADQQFLQAMALAPRLSSPRLSHGMMLVQMARLDEAESVLAKLPPEYYGGRVLRAIIAARRGNLRGSNALMGQLRAQYGDGMHFQYAEIYAQRGLKEQAIDELQKAWIIKDSGLTTLKNDFFLDPLRSDPRFQALVKKLDFPS